MRGGSIMRKLLLVFMLLLFGLAGCGRGGAGTPPAVEARRRAAASRRQGVRR
jgi:predicted small lipoprotein YifL